MDRLDMAGKKANQTQSVETPSNWFRPRSLLDRTFEIGIILKGLDGVIELAGAMIVAFVPAHVITRFVAHLTDRELAKDPNNFIAGHILQYTNELVGHDKWFAVFFLLTHGLIKVVLVFGLLRNLPWAYPFAFLALGGFTVYQFWLIATHPTVGIILLTLFDIFIIWLTWREYQKYKVSNRSKR
jgi:uncharacterized membrane protein